jgi:hypothetical protein
VGRSTNAAAEGDMHAQRLVVTLGMWTEGEIPPHFLQSQEYFRIQPNEMGCQTLDGRKRWSGAQVLPQKGIAVTAVKERGGEIGYECCGS